jgi:peptidoglycan hydrolase CwlO-like protein
VKRTVYHESNQAVSSMKRRFAILLMAACVMVSGVAAVSGCGVRMGMEKIDDAKQAKKQVEKQRHELEKKLQEGQENLEGQ